MGQTREEDSPQRHGGAEGGLRRVGRVLFWVLVIGMGGVLVALVGKGVGDYRRIQSPEYQARIAKIRAMNEAGGVDWRVAEDAGRVTEEFIRGRVSVPSGLVFPGWWWWEYSVLSWRPSTVVVMGKFDALNESGVLVRHDVYCEVERGEVEWRLANLELRVQGE